MLNLLESFICCGPIWIYVLVFYPILYYVVLLFFVSPYIYDVIEYYSFISCMLCRDRLPHLALHVFILSSDVIGTCLLLCKNKPCFNL